MSEATPTPTTTKLTAGQKIEAFAAEVEVKIVTEYGDFDRFLIAHPKTTFFLGVTVAGFLGFVAGHLL